MDQAEISELSLAEYAERINGKVAGLNLAFSLFIQSSQSEEVIESYVRSLLLAETIIKNGIENNEFGFKSELYPEGTLHVLRELMRSLSSSKTKEEKE